MSHPEFLKFEMTHAFISAGINFSLQWRIVKNHQLILFNQNHLQPPPSDL